MSMCAAHEPVVIALNDALRRFCLLAAVFLRSLSSWLTRRRRGAPTSQTFDEPAQDGSESDFEIQEEANNEAVFTKIMATYPYEEQVTFKYDRSNVVEGCRAELNDCAVYKGHWQRFEVGHDVAVGEPVPVAVKFWRVDTQNVDNAKKQVKAIKNEIERLKVLDEKCREFVVRMYNTGDTKFEPEPHVQDNHVYRLLVMEYYEYNLDGFLTSEAPDENAREEIATKLVKGLDAMHNVARMAHRDVKPVNVLVKNVGDSLKVVYCDFGVSKKMAEDNIWTGTNVGTKTKDECWKAPEMDSGKYDAFLADVWSLGLVLYFLATKKSLFGSGDDLRVAEEELGRVWKQREVGGDDTELSKRWVYLRDLVRRMVRFNPEDRITMRQACMHPFLWDRAQAQRYLEVLDDYLCKADEWEGRESHKRLCKAIEDKRVTQRFFGENGTFFDVAPPEWRDAALSRANDGNTRALFIERRSPRCLMKFCRNLSKHHNESAVSLTNRDDYVYDHLRTHFSALLPAVYEIFVEFGVIDIHNGKCTSCGSSSASSVAFRLNDDFVAAPVPQPLPPLPAEPLPSVPDGGLNDDGLGFRLRFEKLPTILAPEIIRVGLNDLISRFRRKICVHVRVFPRLDGSSDEEKKHSGIAVALLRSPAASSVGQNAVNSGELPNLVELLNNSVKNTQFDKKTVKYSLGSDWVVSVIHDAHWTYKY